MSRLLGEPEAHQPLKAALDQMAAARPEQLRVPSSRILEEPGGVPLDRAANGTLAGTVAKAVIK